MTDLTPDPSVRGASVYSVANTTARRELDLFSNTNLKKWAVFVKQEATRKSTRTGASSSASGAQQFNQVSIEVLMRLPAFWVTLLYAVAVTENARSEGITPVETYGAPEVQEPFVRQPWDVYFGGISLGAADGALSVSGTTLSSPYIDSDDVAGLLFGLHIGRFWQSQRRVFGAELSYHLSNIDYSGAVAPPSPPSPPPTVEASRNFDLDHLAELRILAGYEVHPRLLVYTSAGLALGSTTTEFVFSTGGAVSQASDNNTRIGWSAGLGIATDVSRNSFIRGEVSYVDLGTARYVVDDGLGNRADISQGLDFVRITLGYSFKF